MTRTTNYQTRMNKFLSDHLPEGDIKVSTQAEKVIAELEEQDPDLLYGFLMECAPALISDYIRTLLTRHRHTSRRNAYGKALKAGDPSKLRNGLFDRERFIIDESGNYRRLGDMTGKDHEFVARGYKAEEKVAQMRAAFHRALATRVGENRTEEVISAEIYMNMWKEFSQV